MVLKISVVLVKIGVSRKILLCGISYVLVSSSCLLMWVNVVRMFRLIGLNQCDGGCWVSFSVSRLSVVLVSERKKLGVRNELISRLLVSMCRLLIQIVVFQLQWVRMISVMIFVRLGLMFGSGEGMVVLISDNVMVVVVSQVMWWFLVVMVSLVID